MFLSEHERYPKCELGNMAEQEKLLKKGGRAACPPCLLSLIHIFGVGASALVGEDLYNKLLRIDKNVCFCRCLLYTSRCV